MMSQNKLAREFERGATSGRASNVQIHELDDGKTALVGYGHAVYAVRDSSGEITVYGGWAQKNGRSGGGWRGSYSGSPSTKGQFGTMSLTAKADTVVAHESAATRMEESLVDSADKIVDGNGAAPKLREV